MCGMCESLACRRGKVLVARCVCVWGVVSVEDIYTNGPIGGRRKIIGKGVP